MVVAVSPQSSSSHSTLFINIVPTISSLTLPHLVHIIIIIVIIIIIIIIIIFLLLIIIIIIIIITDYQLAVLAMQPAAALQLQLHWHSQHRRPT